MLMMVECRHSLAGDERWNDDASFIAVKIADDGRLQRHIHLGAATSSPATK